MLMSQAPGAFILLGILLGLINWKNQRKAKKAGHLWSPPSLSCSTCKLCGSVKE